MILQSPGLPASCSGVAPTLGNLHCATRDTLLRKHVVLYCCRLSGANWSLPLGLKLSAREPLLAIWPATCMMKTQSQFLAVCQVSTARVSAMHLHVPISLPHRQHRWYTTVCTIWPAYAWLGISHQQSRAPDQAKQITKYSILVSMNSPKQLRLWLNNSASGNDQLLYGSTPVPALWTNTKLSLATLRHCSSWYQRVQEK